MCLSQMYLHIIDGKQNMLCKNSQTYLMERKSAVVKVDVSALASSPDGETCNWCIKENIWWQCI